MCEAEKWPDDSFSALTLPGPRAVLTWSRPLADWRRDVPAGLLTAADRLRLGRLRREQDRSRYATARALLHRAGLIASGLGLIPPGTVVRLRASGTNHGTGRPAPDLPGWQVSISHDTAVVVAFSRVPAGVDTQGLDSGGTIRELTSVFTPDERAWLARHPLDADAVRLWTAKEALLKARGTGFLSDPRLSENDTLRRPGVQLAHWRPFPDATAAMAVLDDEPVDWPQGWTVFGGRDPGTVRPA
ncbi:4'-phosphopantetheinyl transferase family protein [Propionibacterium australiense]|uniref:4'-phosphopantetheinyl transferase superfamily protein n=1 Tax=Propionibacterium australiense TaxID=119981 RepID=A0A383S811_9ACTN|nr:4'-phosphopantetheinyl transferase superfamily protein [Propionibacterium australiense]RLP09620.1 4'-phosphopantetheinyl transferase superfamily protein [Propionibacterium australiense]RLP12322.1 4'-phosphopantetheinyl transferase superfamily protein [Propionibacterium australiense]SYZ33519.1 holo-[acyl-carrier-protein] synthase [Propionibacterium australiense]VEH89646.1 4'-phosphopantetheinyl transferase superfamily [Propionibacterium australiense]